MTDKSLVTEPVRPLAPRLTAAERRTAQIATLATQQAELKHEAAQRRLARERRVDTDAHALQEPEA
jgi:hypothetical protein